MSYLDLHMLLFSDEVKFGEVAMQPPELTARPRKASADNLSAKVKCFIQLFLDIIYRMKPPSWLL